ncbi:MAG: hypothetical protein F4X66_09075 [Chloroflexi bacterium]|nr:hypothetical protein [Chloroflexota bacterium]
MEPNTPPKPTRIARAYLGLVRDFARDHRFITVGLIVTVDAHAVYEIWNRATQPGEAPLVLGIVVIIGYAGVITGAIAAFVIEQGKRRSRRRQAKSGT